ncbi:MAG: T9SS type A sorting domain-containing protein [Bacteroidales bacterium]|nr:T9SS type A sorting domain-containing protein [Bacteroidales bacterium]MCF8403260.1 T9SS type A sorting domain-containing protein [Bacteroidales bacterium]
MMKQISRLPLLFILLQIQYLVISQPSLIKDINPGPGHGLEMNSMYPRFPVLDDNIYFEANDGDNSHILLYKSDGTSLGTSLVKSIDDSGNLYHFTSTNDMIYFTLKKGTSLNQLWRSDGTSNGTILISENNDWSIRNIIPVENDIIFLSKNEVWFSNGTEMGTQHIQTINGHFGSDDPYNVIEEKVYFKSTKTNYSDDTLWLYNNNEKTVSHLFSIAEGSYLNSSVVYNNNLYFCYSNDSFGYLYKVNNSTDEVELIKMFDSPIARIIANNNGLFFRKTVNSNFPYTYQIWKSDGTLTGTMLVTDNNWFGIGFFIPAGDYIYIDSYVNNNQETYGLWKSDGTSNGTIRIHDFEYGINGPASIIQEFYYSNNRLFFPYEDNGEDLHLLIMARDNSQELEIIDTNYIALTIRYSWLKNESLVYQKWEEETGKELWRNNCQASGYLDIEEKERNPLEKIEIYPNPTKKKVVVSNKSINKYIDKIEFYNMDAVLCFSKEVNIPRDQQMNLQFKNLISGIYLVVLYSGEEIISKQKIVVSN